MSGISKIILGLVLLVAGLIAGISWLIFCFGSVIAVVLILIFKPALLFLPFLISVFGLAQIKSGWALLSRNKGGSTGEYSSGIGANVDVSLLELDAFDVDDHLSARLSSNQEKTKTEFDRMMDAHDREMDELLGRTPKRPDDVPF